MGALNTYLQQVQRLLRDQKQDFLNPNDLIDYVNRARRDVANMTQCIRVNPPISGQVVSASVTAGGSGYVNPTVTITPPDFPSGQAPFPGGAQATALPIVSGGVITAIDIQFGGSGYFQPQATITDSAGTGATATLVMSPLNLLIESQEEYKFSDVDLSMFPGVQSILNVREVAIIYANYRYVLPTYAWSVYQSHIRQYPFQYQYVPTFVSQFGQGVNGSLFFYPLPSQSYQMDWDCICQPSDLTTDNSDEAIPQPWRDCVPFLAAYFGYLEIQNMNAARFMKGEFIDFMQRQSNAARIGKVSNPYGRYVWAAVIPLLEPLLRGLNGLLT